MTVQLAAPVEVADNAQDPELLKLPPLSLTKLTVPVGVVGVVEVSATLAVHELSCPVVTEFGEHDRVVVVVSGGTTATLTENVPLLATWLASPL